MNAHVCSACGGTGRIEPRERYCTNPRCQGSAFCLCCGEWCPVCRGSGRISDVRTARDAMVDAETLEVVMWWPAHGEDALKLAQRNGSTARIWARHGNPSRAYADAANAARAAFRAVPALREGE